MNDPEYSSELDKTTRRADLDLSCVRLKRDPRPSFNNHDLMQTFEDGQNRTVLVNDSL